MKEINSIPMAGSTASTYNPTDTFGNTFSLTLMPASITATNEANKKLVHDKINITTFIRIFLILYKNTISKANSTNHVKILAHFNSDAFCMTR